jgi:hypothetical protein
MDESIYDSEFLKFSNLQGKKFAIEHKTMEEWIITLFITKYTLIGRWEDTGAYHPCITMNGSYGDVSFFKDKGYTIIPADDFIRANKEIIGGDEVDRCHNCGHWAVISKPCSKCGSEVVKLFPVTETNDELCPWIKDTLERKKILMSLKPTAMEREIARKAYSDEFPYAGRVRQTQECFLAAAINQHTRKEMATFAEWLGVNGWSITKERVWYFNFEPTEKTTDNLYELYLDNNKKREVLSE